MSKLIKKYFECERNVQKKLLEMYNNQYFIKLLLVGLSTLTVFTVLLIFVLKLNWIMYIIFIPILFLMLLVDIYEGMLTTLGGFLVRGVIWVILISTSICLILENYMILNSNTENILLVCIVTILWSVYSSFCNINVSTTGNALLMGILGIFIEIVDVQYFKNILIEKPYIGQRINEIEILAAALFVVFAVSTIVCALKSYWIKKYYFNEGDIMSFNSHRFDKDK